MNDARHIKRLRSDVKLTDLRGGSKRKLIVRKVSEKISRLCKLLFIGFMVKIEIKQASKDRDKRYLIRSRNPIMDKHCIFETRCGLELLITSVFCQ